MTQRIDPRALERLDETVLLERCARGDESARKQLILRYQEPVFGLVLCLTGGDRNQAYELTVTAFVSLVQAAIASGSGRPVWLLLLPPLLEQASHVTPVPAFESPEAARTTPQKRELLRLVKQSLLAIPFDARVHLLLRDQLGLRYEDIAAVVKLDTKQAKAKTLAARAQFREQLKDTVDRLGR